LQEKEGARGSLSVLEVVDSMHLRKERIAQLSDAFIALPGGFGTLDELCEVVTWSQLGIHQKPIGILNTRGYFDKFLNFIDHAQNEGFIRGVAKDYFMVESSPDFLLGRITKCLARSV
jgi:uncharacterized protein (TIGR00730 family)